MLSEFATLNKNFADALKAYLSGDSLEAATSLYRNYLGVLRKRSSYENGQSVLSYDWDVLIILDACRVDALRLLMEKYTWLEDVGKYPSVAGKSDDWMVRTFDSKAACESMTYVSSNPYSVNNLHEEWFTKLVQLTETDWSEKYDTVAARPVTDSAIRNWRTVDSEKMVVHYMQPHFPSIPALDGEIPVKTFGRSAPAERWKKVQNDEITKIEIIESYLANLEYVLDEVDLLLDNIDAPKVMITADHGTCLGEWGVYGHAGISLPKTIQVPQVWTEGVDKGKYTPPERAGSADTTRELDDQLAALGYKS